MRNNGSYINIGDERSHGERPTPWYWKVVALASSWMILGGYLILPGLYMSDNKDLKIGQPVLLVFVVALLTAGYSFTALLCFACRNERFQAEGVFLPALASSAIGLVSIAYNFLSSRAYHWGTSAITGTVVSSTATLTYGALLLWTQQRVSRSSNKESGQRQLWSSEAYYSNFNQNMFPTAQRSSPDPVGLDEDGVNQQMRMLLTQSDRGPSPRANNTTFQIDLPEDIEQQEREARSQELVGTPGPAHYAPTRDRADSRPDSLSENQAWERWQERGRTPDRPGSTGQRSGHSRNPSREERRREIELGFS